MKRECVFSPDRKYRYTLWREWGDLLTLPQTNGFAAIIGLNPSTADETADDPTIRRCVGYVKAWGYNAFCMLNLFAIRSTDPKALYISGSNPIGHDNLDWLLKIAKEASLVVAAWGSHGDHLHQGQVVRAFLTGNGIKLQCFGKTSTGQPKHPLYLSKDLKLKPL